MTLSFLLAEYSLDPASHPFLSLYTFCILTIISFHSLISRNRGKSRFLCDKKETWDRLIEEARLLEEVTAQLFAAQQRVAELTPLDEEVDNLRSRVADACHHTDEAERAFKTLSERSWKDNEEAAKVRKEWDELL